jgi:uncharacterized protein (TIGR02145 family)
MMKYTYKGVLAVVLSIFVATAFAQTATVNSDTTTTGTAVASGATATFTDPRDGKQYKTVVMPDGRTWFAQNLNYTKDLTFNMYANQANGKLYLLPANGVPAIGSYWCPGMNGSTYSGDQNTWNNYGALYTWETVMMVDGKYADETKTSSAWDNSWLAGNYYNSGSPAENPNADKNNARGGTNVKGGGRGICPAGWHIPTYREWAVMLDAVEGVNTHMQTAPFITNRIGAAGNLLKSAKIMGLKTNCTLYKKKSI